MLIDGKKIALEIQMEIQAEVSLLQGRKPCLAVIIIGNHPASLIYVRRKMEACKNAGIGSILLNFEETLTKDELISQIHKLNQDSSVDGILVQLPLPPHMNPTEINEHISPAKDVDGFHPLNLGKLLMGEKTGFTPCTPLGIQSLIQRSGFEIAGKHVVIIGRSTIVGKPTAALLMSGSSGGNATVTILHSHSQNIEMICQMADIIVVAIGRPFFLKKEMVKKEAIVIDVGINRIENKEKPGSFKIVGDADFESLKDHCRAITPVPGGVGPMTIAMLLSNTLKSFKQVN